MTRSARQAQRAAGTTSDPRWAAVVARDAAADRTFVYSVRTTGVYCRPSCPSRPARPENVRFHATCADAVAAGFRPCKRCTPDQPSLLERQTATVTRCLPPDRSLRSDTEPGGAGRGGGHEPLPFPPRVQSPHRPDAARLRNRAPGQPGAPRTREEQHRDTGDLPIRLQLERALLRQVGRRARHDADRLSRRGRHGRDPVRHRRMLAGRDPGGTERPGRVRDHAGRRPRGAGTRPPGALSPGRADRWRRGIRGAGGERGGIRRGAGPGPGLAARRARHGLPAAGVAGAAGDPGRPDRDVQ